MPTKSAVPPDTRKSSSADSSRLAFAERLRTLVQNWPSADGLARAAGVSPSAFRKWLKGQAEPSRERLIALADATGADLGWLARGAGPEPVTIDLRRRVTGAAQGRSAGNADPKRFVFFPKHPEAVAAGSGHPAALRTTEFIGFHIDWLRKHFEGDSSNLLLEIAVGDSMQPLIKSGDLLLVDTDDHSLENFGVYVIAARDERLVKRVQKKFDGSLILISDNNLYQPEQIAATLATEVQVIGRVVWRGGSL